MYSLIAKNARRPRGALIVAGLLCASGACSRSHTVTTADGKVSYQEKGKDARTVTVTGKDGQTATLNFNQNKVPDDYPKDVPIYSPAKIVMSQSISQENARNLVLESADGWKTESTMTTAQLTMLTSTKAQRQLTLQISDSGDKRGVMQILTDKK